MPQYMLTGSIATNSMMPSKGRLARQQHPQAVAAFFARGFMTKFVAAIFLPAILMLTAAMLLHWRRRVLQDWRAWAALLLILLATVPWFAYQTIESRGRVLA